jgi:hypothetical protein
MRLRIFTLVVLTGVIVSSADRPCFAQERRDFVESLLRGLIDTQLDRARRRDDLPDPFQPRDQRPDRDARRPTAEMQQLRPILATFAQEAAGFAAAISNEARRSPELRRYVADAVQLQAEATATSQQAQTHNDHRAVLPDLQQLSSDWLTLSHQLEGRPVLSGQARQVMRRLARLDQQYRDLLQIEPQLNNADLVREAYALDAHVQDLIEQLDSGRYRGSDGRQLRFQLGRHHHEVSYFAQLVARGARFEQVVQEYTDLYQTWRNQQPGLQQVRSSAIARSVRQIEDSHRIVHDLLGLEFGMNEDMLLHLVHETVDELNLLKREITLEHLLALPEIGGVPEAVDTFDGTLQNLDSVLHLNRDQREIGEAWLYADEAWQMVVHYLDPLDDRDIRAHLAAVSQNLSTLQRIIGVTVEFDRNAIERTASVVTENAEHLHAAVKKWLRRPGQKDNGSFALSQRLVDQSRTLQQAFFNHRTGPDFFVQQTEGILVTWQQLRPLLRAIETEERQTVDFIVTSLTRELIRLRTMVGDQ